MFEERVHVVNVPVQVEVDLWVCKDDHVTLYTPDGTPYGTTIQLLGENEISSERHIEEFTFSPPTIGFYRVNIRNSDGEDVPGSPVHVVVNRLIVGFQISDIPFGKENVVPSHNSIAKIIISRLPGLSGKSSALIGQFV